MNYVKRHYLKQLYKLLLDNLIDSPVSGSLDIVDNDIRLNIIGLVKTIKIEYTGIINIQNNLPGGYSIKLNKNIIKIRNINAKKLADDGLLFIAKGNFRIIDCDKCQFIHVMPLPSELELSKLYKRKYYTKVKPNYIKKYQKEIDYWNLIFDEKLNTFISCLPSNTSIIACCAFSILKLLTPK